MTEPRRWSFPGTREPISVATWSGGDPRYLAVVVHGYAEHGGRYQGLAEELVAHGATVYAPDHLGHGLSGGERAYVKDYEDVVGDVRTVVEHAHADHPGQPLVMIGNSVGGAVAARYAQLFPDELAGLVLVAPVLGTWQTASMMLSFAEIPTMPYDLGPLLSRDAAAGAGYNADPLVWHGPFQRATLEAIVRLLDAVTVGGTLGRLPTLWLHGTADQLAPIGDTAVGVAAIRGTGLRERRYRGALHTLFEETNRRKVVKHVSQFVDGCL